MSKARNAKHRMKVKDAKGALLQIATGRMSDAESIKRTAKRVFDALPDRDEWDAPGGAPAGPRMVDGIPYWPDVGETVEAPVQAPPPAAPKKKGGRPKGSKNKAKVEPGRIL